MTTIRIIDRKTALHRQRETVAGDVHVCITDVDSKNPHRAWWITEEALNTALQTVTLDGLDRLVGSAPSVRTTSAEYPMRGYYLPLLRDNQERTARGEADDSLWHWRDLRPSTHSFVSTICRWDGLAWISRTGERMF